MRDVDAVYEKYKHMDEVLSDRQWSHDGIISNIACDLWTAIKEARSEAPAEEPDMLERLADEAQYYIIRAEAAERVIREFVSWYMSRPAQIASTSDGPRDIPSNTASTTCGDEILDMIEQLRIKYRPSSAAVERGTRNARMDREPHPAEADKLRQEIEDMRQHLFDYELKMTEARSRVEAAEAVVREMAAMLAGLIKAFKEQGGDWPHYQYKEGIRDINKEFQKIATKHGLEDKS